MIRQELLDERDRIENDVLEIMDRIMTNGGASSENKEEFERLIQKRLDIRDKIFNEYG